MPTLIPETHSRLPLKRISRIERKENSEKRLIEQLFPLVWQVVNRMAVFLPSYIIRNELIGPGLVGLIHAVRRYDATRGCSLNTYCTLRIRGAIIDELRRLDWVPRSVHHDAKMLSQAQEKLAQILGRAATTEEIKAELHLSDKAYQALVERAKPAAYFSLHEPASGSDDPDAILNEEMIADTKMPSALDQVLRREDRELLLSSLRRLPKAQSQVLVLYYIEDLQLKEIAEILQLTESRISQIHTLAIIRLRAIFDRERMR